jgi:putative transcriptional regulator
MSKAAFDQIAAGLEEALAVSRGETAPFRLHVTHPIDIKAIRTGLGMTQKDFAATFGFGLDQLKQWEQGRSRPLDAMRAYLLLIEAEPQTVMQTLKAARTIHADEPLPA